MAITGNQTFNNWNWPNAMIFAATVITTIGKPSEIFRIPSSMPQLWSHDLVGVKIGPVAHCPFDTPLEIQ